MADPLKQICDELGVCTEEALFYLEGFRWDLNAAMDACRSKTLPSPSLTADQPPSKENEKATEEEEQSGDEKIVRFVQSTGATVEEARHYLSGNNWSVDDACRSFSGHGFDHQPEKKQKPWYLQGFSGDLVQDVLSQVPQFRDPSSNLRIGSPPSASTAPFEPTQESIKQFGNFVSDASSKAVIDCLKECKGDAHDAFLYFYGDYSKKNPTECIRDEVKEERIASFATTTGKTKQAAKVYLEKYNWNLQAAINFFFDGSALEEQTSVLNTSSSGPTETQRSFEGDVTVTIPGVASSQVDGKAGEGGSSTETVPDPFANRGRTTVETQAAPSTIVMTIVLADMPGTELELPFKSNQTLRDIRNAIDQRYPDKGRGYVLQSMDGDNYIDWNITVDRVSTRGSRIYQVDP